MKTTNLRINNSFWLDIEATPTVGSGSFYNENTKSLTVADFKDEAKFTDAGCNFTEDTGIWKIDTYAKYPTLQHVAK